MNASKIINGIAGTLIGFSAFSIIMVSLMAFKDPQAIMDLVQVKLTNNDAYSSIRGVYGGTGMTMCIIFIYLLVKDTKLGLKLISIFWGLYAFSRIITMMAEGPLDAFGQKWLGIELCFCLLSLIVLTLKLRMEKQQLIKRVKMA